MLFITSVDVLHVLLRNVVDNGLIEGLVGIWSSSFIVFSNNSGLNTWTGQPASSPVAHGACAVGSRGAVYQNINPFTHVTVGLPELEYLVQIWFRYTVSEMKTYQHGSNKGSCVRICTKHGSARVNHTFTVEVELNTPNHHRIAAARLVLP
jgi:hypothetical protein